MTLLEDTNICRSPTVLNLGRQQESDRSASNPPCLGLGGTRFESIRGTPNLLKSARSVLKRSYFEFEPDRSLTWSDLSRVEIELLQIRAGLSEVEETRWWPKDLPAFC
jgi:hypothetical protein